MMTERRRAAVLAVLMTAVSLMVVLPREGAAEPQYNPLLNYEPLMGDPDGPSGSGPKKFVPIDGRPFVVAGSFWFGPRIVVIRVVSMRAGKASLSARSATQ